MRSNLIRDAERQLQGAFRLVGTEPAPEIETSAPDAVSGRLVASVNDNANCAQYLDHLVASEESFYDLLNDPDMQDWAGTEEGKRELTQTIGDILDDINIFMAECGHLLTDAERAKVNQLRGAMNEAQAALHRFEELEPRTRMSILREFGANAVDVAKTVGGAAARVAGGIAGGIIGGILYILQRLPTPQRF